MPYSKSFLMAFPGLLLLFSSGCKTLKTNQNLSPVFEIEKTACFGQCPVFIMKFYANGTVELNSKENIPELGLFEMQLSRKDIKEFEEELAAMNFCRLEKIYGSNAMDFPSTFVRYSCEGEIKSVEAVTEIPEKLQNFIQTIDKLRQGGNWSPSGSNETSS